MADNPELKTVAGNNKSIQFARRQLIFTKNSSKDSGTKNLVALKLVILFILNRMASLKQHAVKEL